MSKEYCFIAFSVCNENYFLINILKYGTLELEDKNTSVL